MVKTKAFCDTEDMDVWINKMNHEFVIEHMCVAFVSDGSGRILATLVYSNRYTG